MAAIESLHTLYETYIQKAQKVRSKASRFAGAFNLGDDPRRHECHEQFYEDVELWVAEFLKSEPSAEEASEVVHWILEAADTHRDMDVYWYMYASHTHVIPVLPMLPREECRQLIDWYDSVYPALDRLPAQREVYRQLQICAGVKNTGRSGGKFRWFLGKK